MNNSVYFDKPFAYSNKEKSKFFLAGQDGLTDFHYKNCAEYKNMLDVMYPNFFKDKNQDINTIPFLPVTLFKEMSLKSIDNKDVYKTLASSGTTSQTPSKVILDRETATLQSKVLIAIVKNFIGSERLPMIIIDQEATIRNPAKFNARAAGIIGFSGFGKDHLCLLDENMQVKKAELGNFLQRHQDEKILVFGFTFMVWKYFYQECLKRNYNVDLHNGVLIHGGGWKKLENESVSTNEFTQKLTEQFNLKSIHNYYGFIEQVGSIFMECEAGHLHASAFSDILVRDRENLKVLPFGKIGLIQSLSLLPYSYPGHSILTEDLGVCLGEDDCPCGRLGKYFQVLGRIPAAELRGCSDVY